jgi:hypothetical protein
LPVYTWLELLDSVDVAAGADSDCIPAVDQGMITAPIKKELADESIVRAFIDGPNRERSAPGSKTRSSELARNP